MKSNQRRETAWGAVLFLAAFSLYLDFLSKSYVFEGLARAMPIEVGRFRNLFNGNYLLYGFVGWCFHHFLQAVGVDQLAVISLQALDALIGALGLWVYFRLLRRIGADIASALLWSLILGVTLGYWRWSTDAEDYIFSTFLLLINFYALVLYSEKSRIHPAHLGALHALAVTGHIVNIVFAPVILWFISSKHGKGWKKPAITYAATVCLLVLAAYSAALLIVRPGGPYQAVRWLMGSAARGDVTGGFTLGGGPSWFKLWLWIKMTGNILTSYLPDFGDPPSWRSAAWLLWAARACLAILAVTLVWRSNEIFSRHRTVAVGCCLWLVSYALVFTSWQPDTMVYRTTDLPAICLLLSLVSLELELSLRLGLSILLAASLGLGNFGAEIFPRSFAGNNPDLKRMAFIREHTTQADWITGGGGRDELYLPYFAQRRPLIVDRFTEHPEDLALLIGELMKNGQSVYVTTRTLQDAFWRAYFKAHSLRSLAADETGFTLYRLTGPKR